MVRFAGKTAGLVKATACSCNNPRNDQGGPFSRDDSYHGRRDPLISPLFADLHGFARTLVQVGSAETLLDDAVRFAAAAGAQDVNVTLEIWPHMIHAWPMWNAKLAGGCKALSRAGEFMRQWV